MKNIALLRGINVGGKNKIAMTELKKTLEKKGFLQVSTYINSGNIIYEATKDTDLIIEQQKITSTIEEEFNLKIPVLVISEEELAEDLSKTPPWWGNDQEDKHNALFVIRPATVEEVIAQVGEAKEEYEKIKAGKRIIFWTAPLKTFNKTRWSKIHSTKAYGQITIRNANTTKKLLELCKK